MDPNPIPGTLGVRCEYTPEEDPVHPRAACTNIRIHVHISSIASLHTSMLWGGGKKPENPDESHKENMETPTEKVNWQ